MYTRNPQMSGVLFPSAGITRIRLFGYDLSPYYRTPLSNYYTKIAQFRVRSKISAPNRVSFSIYL